MSNQTANTPRKGNRETDKDKAKMHVADALHVVVRDLPSQGLEGAFRVHVLPESLQQAQLKLGDVCEITSEDGTTGYGIAWRADDRMGNRPKNRPAKMTETFRSACGFEEGSKVTISGTDVKVSRADKIVLTDVTPAEYHKLDEADDGCWRIRIEHLFSQCEAVAPGIAFDVVGKKKLRRRYYIDTIESSAAPDASLFSICDETNLVISGVTTHSEPVPENTMTVTAINGASSTAPNSNRSSSISQAMNRLSIQNGSASQHTLNTDRIGGLLEATQKLNSKLRILLNAAVHMNSLLQSRRPILIHGYEGTGKSMLLDRLADAAFKKVLRLRRSTLNGGSVSKNQDIIKDQFREAVENQPALILMDNLEKLAPADDVAYASTLAEQLELLQGTRVMVVAATRSPSDIESSLLMSPRFTVLIELPIPDLATREQILNVLRRRPAFAKDSVSSELAARTHGFTGNDLAIFCDRASDHAEDRYLREIDEAAMARSPTPPAYEQVIQLNDGRTGEPSPVPTLEPTLADFEAVLPGVRPAALREMFTEKPRTTWAHIGGSNKVKESFDRIIGRPLKSRDRMEKLGLQPPKGVLLYGPPGCSKTLTAQAVANSYNFNFIAIKGAELISMYVGESERAVREVFRKARTAAPCVIFFDEIDSIGADRDGGGTKGLNVLTTLLNEMDGFETLKDVFILAATNKPETLDPALMRPGRFDKLVYLGPPNDVARQEILMLATRNVSLSADISIDNLVAETEGYSGAEIMRISHVAKEVAFDRCEAIGNEVRVCSADFEEALSEVRKGITSDMLAAYEAFARRGEE